MDEQESNGAYLGLEITEADAAEAAAFERVRTKLLRIIERMLDEGPDVAATESKDGSRTWRLRDLIGAYKDLTSRCGGSPTGELDPDAPAPGGAGGHGLADLLINYAELTNDDY